MLYEEVSLQPVPEWLGKFVKKRKSVRKSLLWRNPCIWFLFG
jgi:hypothetical protein